MEELNSLTAIETISRLGGLQWSHKNAELDVLSSIPCSVKNFSFLGLLLFLFYLCVQNTLFVMKFYNYFCHVNLVYFTYCSFCYRL